MKSTPHAAAAPAPLRRRVLNWVVAHDDHWLFTVVYLSAAVLLSLLISLFWLIVVVAAHALLEVYALRHRGESGPYLGRVLWHLKLDIGLILFALVLGVYMELLFGLAGLSAAARTGAQAGARFLAWQKALRGVLLTLDDAAQVARLALRRGSDGSDATAPNSPVTAPWRGGWTWGDRCSLGFAALMLLLLIAPWTTDQSLPQVLALIAQDLHPWPF